MSWEPPIVNKCEREINGHMIKINFINIKKFMDIWTWPEIQGLKTLALLTLLS